MNVREFSAHFHYTLHSNNKRNIQIWGVHWGDKESIRVLEHVVVVLEVSSTW